MQIVRFRDSGSGPSYGWVYQDKVGKIEGNIFSDFRRSEPTLPLNKVELLAPVVPSKIICVGRNFETHARELGNEVPQTPLLFLKPPSALIGHGMAIKLPAQSEKVEHEAELAAVIGRRGKRISPRLALEHVFGFTIANDVTARDLQRSDKQWTRAKGFDTFCPLGPWIETDFDPVDAMITCHVNGTMRQMASTRDMVFTVSQLITYASSIMTLEPGDLLLTGTPAGVARLESGDTVEISISGIGTLMNTVRLDDGHQP